MNNLILDINDLHIEYRTDNAVVHAVNGLSLSLCEGETLGLVGETGAGKTSTALGILRLLPEPQGVVTQGDILFEGQSLLKKSRSEMRAIRGKQISMIFQDPMTALNPILTVGDQIAEVVRLHDRVSRGDAARRAQAMLEMVGIPGERYKDYPHQFSGGMKQRVVIAISLACNPRVLIADEPTTALDVTIQAQVLELMIKLREQFHTSTLLITHDLGVVAEMCDHVAVVYCGEVVEYGAMTDIYDRPAHPYTVGLFGSIPDLESQADRLVPIPGSVPDPANLPEGCRFANRCPRKGERCGAERPGDISLGGAHRVRCFYPVGEKEGE